MTRNDALGFYLQSRLVGRRNGLRIPWLVNGIAISSSPPITRWETPVDAALDSSYIEISSRLADSRAANSNGSSAPWNELLKGSTGVASIVDRRFQRRGSTPCPTRIAASIANVTSNGTVRGIVQEPMKSGVAGVLENEASTRVVATHISE